MLNNDLPYKILSFGSESPDTPISNLLQSGSVWQSSRFCTFPQQITVKLQKVFQIEKIQFLAHRCMIPSRIQILYLNSTGKQPNIFHKYGYVRFSSNEETNFEAREQKTLDVDISCDHLRFLLHKPHQNRLNYFSQVGLQEINISSGKEEVLHSSTEFHPVIEPKTSSILKVSSHIKEGFQQEYINDKIKLLEEKKQLAVEEERYDEAQRIKDIMTNIIEVQEQIEAMVVKKHRAVELENYDEAKKIKNQIERIKKSTQDIIKNYLQGGNQNTAHHYNPRSLHNSRPRTHHEIQTEIDEDRQDLNEFVEDVVGLQSQQNFEKHRLNVQSSFDRQIPYHKQIINYDERVIPAILNKDKPPVEDQFENSRLPEEPEELDPNSAKQQQMASVFGEDVTRRFFSKHWQFRLEAISAVASQLETPKLTKDKNPSMISVCFLKVIADGIKSSVFQICQAALHLCQNLMNNKTIQPIKGEIDYDTILYEVVKRLSDNNVKIRGMSEQLFKMMAASSLYGVGMCSSMLIKTVTANSRLSNIQIQQRLDHLTYFVNQYGLGHGNVPASAVQFAGNYIYHQYAKIRSSAVDLLVVCYLVGGEEKVKFTLEKLKKQTSEEIYKKIKDVEKEREGEKTKQKAKNQKPTNQAPKSESKPKPTKDKEKQKEKKKGK